MLGVTEAGMFAFLQGLDLKLCAKLTDCPMVDRFLSSGYIFGKQTGRLLLETSELLTGIGVHLVLSFRSTDKSRHILLCCIAGWSFLGTSGLRHYQDG